jgi:aryl-phospho-beta-D-glucosidase BglC (GH1 family)
MQLFYNEQGGEVQMSIQRVYTAFIIGLNLLITGGMAASPIEVNQWLGQGINLGNALEAPSEGAWGVTLEESYFKLIKEKGFQSVRIPVRWYTAARADTNPPYTITPAFMSRVQWAVDNALKNGLCAIINQHHYEPLYETPEAEREKFLALWEQIASHFKDYSDSLVFEILNEPHGNLSAALWNPLCQDALSVIRNSNPGRTVMIGIAEYGGIGGLSKLQLPDDSNLILTVHYYNPFHFTHQGASWVDGADAWLGTEWSGSYYEKTAVINEFAAVHDFAQKNDIPVNVGEFGAYSAADMTSRALWTEYCARLFESYGYSWHYWEFCSGFGIYNPQNGAFRTELVSALLSDDTTTLIVQEEEINGDNIVVNGDFSNGLNGWEMNDWDGAADVAVEKGAAGITVQTNSADSWGIQFQQTGVTLVDGQEYALQFDVRADASTQITGFVDNTETWTQYGSSGSVLVTTDVRTYTVVFTMPEGRTDGRIGFNVGSSQTKIYIDNVKLIAVDKNTPVLPGSSSRRHGSLRGTQHTGGRCSVSVPAGGKSFRVRMRLFDIAGRLLFQRHGAMSPLPSTTRSYHAVSSARMLIIDPDGAPTRSTRRITID